MELNKKKWIIKYSFIGVPINVTYTERIVATVYCAGDYIVEFITTSPLYMKKTAPALVSGTTNQWFITLTWIPTDDQKGPQVWIFIKLTEREKKHIFV